ncbi:RagB/SusD family nutrient uptake outer membrane protein [Myroides sp. LJL115]
MKNKLLKYIAAVIVVSTTLTGCDLETSPTNAVSSKDVYKTASGGEKVLVGTWGNLMESFSTYANPGYGAFLRTSDAMGSDVVVNLKYGFTGQYAFNTLYSKGGTNTFSWNLTYRTINSVNEVIANVPQSEGDVNYKQRIIGQAYAFRGFLYLHLASSYGFAVDFDPHKLIAPIYTEPTGPDTEGQPASSVIQVYNQALSDLEQALELIPSDYVRDSKYKFDRSVVLGLLSRANLYAQNWDKAVEYSQELLNEQATSILMNEAQYKSGFSDVSNPEWIWGHPQTAEQNGASYQFNYLDVTSQQSYYFSFNADPYFADLFDQDDYRKSMMYWAPDPSILKPENGTTAYFRYAKFKFKGAQVADIVLMRNSEIYLINAEANAHLQNNAQALESLNALKRARGAKEISQLSGKDLLEQIWIERRKELFGEGFALVDIIRNQQSVVRKDFPQTDLIPYTYKVMNSDGQITEVTVGLLPQGHRILNFPDKSSFTPNSDYYLYRIPEIEELENKNLFPQAKK